MKPDEAEKDKSSAVAVFPQDARDDVGGAQNAGMLGILVRTGKTEISPKSNLGFICECK